MVNAASPPPIAQRGLCAYGGSAAHPFGSPSTSTMRLRLTGARSKRTIGRTVK